MLSLIHIFTVQRNVNTREEGVHTHNFLEIVYIAEGLSLIHIFPGLGTGGRDALSRPGERLDGGLGPAAPAAAPLLQPSNHH